MANTRLGYDLSSSLDPTIPSLQDFIGLSPRLTGLQIEIRLFLLEYPVACYEGSELF